MKNIFITGQCSIHLGRMEFGNIGNFYILEQIIKNICEYYKDYNIYTTLQISNDFSKKFKNLIILPLEYYYDFKNQNDNKNKILNELIISYNLDKYEHTEYIKYCLKSDIIFQFDGDMWGDNADIFGIDKSYCGYLKSLIAQNCCNDVRMIAGSPGPFNNCDIELVKKIYNNFSKISHREELSYNNIKKYNFNMEKTTHYPCPSFSFKHNLKCEEIDKITKTENINENTIGFILCGWNFTNGNFNDEDRNIEDFEDFIELINFIHTNYKYNILLISHNNGFDHDKKKLIRGRDYYISKKLYDFYIKKYPKNKNKISLLKNIYNPYQTKALLSKLFINISGRLHGSVGSLTEEVPTLMIKYGNGPKSHKLNGFMKYLNIEEYICNPKFEDMKKCFIKIILNYDNYKNILKTNLNTVKIKSIEHIIWKKE